MTTLATVLNGAAVLTTAAAPTLGNINSYNATAGALAVALPALSGLNVGASCIVEKNVADASAHTITFTAHSGDTFDDAATTLALQYSGEKRTLQVITISGTKYWKITNVSSTNTAPATASVQWSGGTAGVLPATGGQHLTTQGGNTLDDGTGNVLVHGTVALLNTSAPTSVAGQGFLYVASDGLHFLGPTTDTLIAPS